MKHTQLVAAVTNVNGASFIGLDTLTEVKLTGGKKNPMQGRVTKEMLNASVMVFSNTNVSGYAAMIARRLEQEGKDPSTFILGDRAWGTRVPNMPIIEHFKDGVVKYYAEVIFLKPGKVTYMLDGVAINKADIVGLNESEEGHQGGLENKVIIRAFAADSITCIRANGQEYR